MKKWILDMARNEIELDKGSTVQPEEFQVTDELIEKIRKGEVKVSESGMNLSKR